MFHRELKINFGQLEEAETALAYYVAALTGVSDGLTQAGAALEQGEGEAHKALMEHRAALADRIAKELEAAQCTHTLLQSYITDMTDIIEPGIRGQQMVVDSNDIWGNMITMKSTISHLEHLDSYIRNPGGNTCTANPDKRTKKAEEGYYRWVQRVREETIAYYADRIQGIYEEIKGIYNDRIVPYENTDDDYALAAMANYNLHTDASKKNLDKLDWIGTQIAGLGSGAWDGITDLFQGIGQMGEMVFSLPAAGITYAVCSATSTDTPDWVSDTLINYQLTKDAYRSDPFLLAEMLCQGASDAVEQKGAAYCIGYIGSDIILGKGIDKAVRSARLMGGAGEVSGRARKLFRGAGRLDDVDDLIPRLRQLEDILPADDIAAYKKFLQNRSPAGLTQEELQAIQRVDDYLALDQADFDELLRRGLGESGSTSKYLEQLDNISENKINHIINGSKNSNHGWENLVPDKNWNDIKNIIANVMDTGVEGPYKAVFSKKAVVNGFEVEVTYTKLSDGTIKISDAWVN